MATQKLVNVPVLCSRQMRKLKTAHNPEWQTLVCAAELELPMTSEFLKDLIVCDNGKGKDKQVCSSVSKLMATHIWAAENSAS